MHDLLSSSCDTYVSIAMANRARIRGNPLVFGWIGGTYNLSNQYQYVEFETDGTSWHIISRN